MPPREVGAAIIVVGLTLVVLGGLMSLGALGWFGRLPGDVRIETGRISVHAPIASMLLVSLLLSALVAVARRLF